MRINLWGLFKRKKHVDEKPPGPQPLKQNIYFTHGILHACVTLDPDTFEEMIGNARLPATKWYRALWLVQHDPNIGVTVLAEEIKVSWPTAQTMKARIIEFVTVTNGYSNKLEKSE